MIILEIVKKLTEENTYFSTYTAKLSTSDHSRYYLLDIQTRVCAASRSRCEGRTLTHRSLLFHHKTGWSSLEKPRSFLSSR